MLLKGCHKPGNVVGCHLLCSGFSLARGVVLQLFVQTYHRLLSAFWLFFNQCLFNSFRQVIWLECESKRQRCTLRGAGFLTIALSIGVLRYPVPM